MKEAKQAIKDSSKISDCNSWNNGAALADMGRLRKPGLKGEVCQVQKFDFARVKFLDFC